MLLIIILVPWLTTIGDAYNLPPCLSILQQSHRVNSFHSVMLSAHFFRGMNLYLMNLYLFVIIYHRDRISLNETLPYCTLPTEPSNTVLVVTYLACDKYGQF